ncbi:MAG: 5,10-methylenetetrahydromethanopterin reductase [Halioglobus sp.]|jgi:5,10-methylenetetrahydromethanopterin reductase
MKIGIMTGSGYDPDFTLQGMMDNAKRIEQLGFDSLWMATIYNYDALTALAAIGTVTERIELGTAVTATHPRHPMAMAQQALTTSAACQGRFTLGIGLSHKYVIETEMGMSYDKPAQHMREYLEVLTPLLRDNTVAYAGDRFSTHATLAVPESGSPSLVIGALGPAMLKLAGSRADGTTLWLTGPRTIGEHTVPTIRKAAQDAERPEPRIIAGMPVILTDEPEAARTMISEQLGLYSGIPSYKAMLDLEGAIGPGDVALVGNEQELRQQIRALGDIGVTDLNAVLVNDDPAVYERTLEFLAGEIQR